MKKPLFIIRYVFLSLMAWCVSSQGWAQDATPHTLRLQASPSIGGSFNIDSISLASGEEVRLHAFASPDFVFKQWKDDGGKTISSAQQLPWSMTDANMTLTAEFEYNPASPANPGTNAWDATTGAVIADDFVTGRLSTAINTLIGGSSHRNEVLSIIVAGVMGDNDWGIVNNYGNCSVLDLSRVAGVTEIPSYAFDYTSIATVYLPASIEKIGARAFADCSNLSSLTIYAMTPPTLESNVFRNVADGLVVYVPAAVIPLYEEAEGWKDFTILPIQEDIRNINVSLPSGSRPDDFAQMWLELTNTKSGQRMHYVMTDRTTYTFQNIIRNTVWNVTLRNERGDIFGHIDNVEVKDEDVSVAFASLSKPQVVTLAVLTPAGEDVTAQAQVAWTDAEGNYVAQGTALSGLPTGFRTWFHVELSQDLAMAYHTPDATEYVLKDGGNSVVCRLAPIPQVHISGKVKEAETGLALNGAVVSASQTFGGKYTQTLTAKTDRTGAFSLDIANMPTSVAFAADGYVSQTMDCGELLAGKTAVELDEVALKAISGVTIGLELSYTECSAEGEEAETLNWYGDFQNVAFDIYDVSKNRAVSQFSIQYPQIVLLEDVEDGSVLRITASSLKNAFMPVVKTVTVVEQKASVAFDIKQLGKIQVAFGKTGNAAVVGSLYDAGGKLMKTYNFAANSLTIDDIADGTYRLVLMGSSTLYNTVYDLAQLPQTGLAEGKDYVLKDVTVSSGVISQVDVDVVPVLNEAKLYYTGDNTSFTVNKPSIVVGNYLTLTGRIDFKQAYAQGVGNVQMVVDLPETCEFVENSVMVGNNTSSYMKNGQQIVIPVNRLADRVRFCVIPTLGGDYAPSAFVQFDLDGKTVTQPIGSANYTAQNLTISVPETVAKTAVPISGTAIGTSNVEIYDNGVLIGQTKSLANGTWTTTCELNEPYNLSSHNIYAKVTTKNGLELVSEKAECIYDMNAIQVAKVTMYHYNPEWNKTFESVFDFLNPPSKPNQWTVYYPNKKFTYKVDFTNNSPEKVSNVVLYVHTADGQKVPLYPTYNEEKDTWLADIDMGHRSDGYYPVNVSVGYDASSQPLVDTKSFDNDLRRFEQIGKDLKDELKKLDTELDDDIDDTTYESEFLSFEELLKWDEEYVEENIEEINVDSLMLIYNAVSDLFILSRNEKIQLPDGSIAIVKSCEGIDESELEGLGYEKYETVDNKNVYIFNTDGHSIMIDFSDDIYFEIEHIATDNHRMARFASGLDVFNEWVSKIQGFYLPIRDAYEDLQNSIGSLVANLEYDFEKFSNLAKKYDKTYKSFSTKLANAEYLKNSGTLDPWQINEVNAKIASYKASKAKYKKLLDAAKRSKWLTEKTLPVVRKLSPQLKRICPLIKYADMITQGVKVIYDYRSLYASVPDPCPNDSIGADRCRENVRNGGAWVFGLLAAKLGTQALLDIGVASQAVGSVATGGITLVTAFATAVGKMVLGIALDAAFDQYNTNKQKSLKAEIQALKCKKDPDPDPDPDPNPGPNPGPGPGPEPYPGPNDDVQIDPSGYVYEAVHSNRMEGVTATIFYKEDVEDMYGDLHENIVKWDAAEYAQENPLFTDEYGMYRWDVPQGLWQVKYEKVGYETAYSEWLPVPPPQLDVNVGMKQNRQPEVRMAHAYETAVEVEFDKYMMPDLLTTDNIMVMQDGKAVAGEVVLLNEEAAYEGSDEAYASKVRFNAAQPFTAKEVTLMVNNRVKSYAGIRMQDNYSQTFAVEQEVRQIDCDSLLVVDYGGSESLVVSVVPASAAKGKRLHVKTSSPMIVGVESEQVTIGDDGTATIRLTGELPGSAGLTFSVEGIDKSATTIVNVIQKGFRLVATPTASVISGTAVVYGTGITLSCSTDGATIYYTLDGACPCDDSPSRFVYDGTPIIVTADVTIKVMAVAPGMEDSDVAEFRYIVDTEDIVDVAAQGQVRVWPVPVRDRLNVAAGGKTIRRVTVAAPNGVVALTADKASKQMTVDVGTLPPGIYLVNVFLDDGNYSCKVVKK